MSRKLIEAALFMSSRPMSAEEISRITGVAPGNVEKTLDILCKEYNGEVKGVEIIRVPEGWEMRVKPELLPKVAHLTPYSDLKDGHKRTLALVAYKEPLRQSEAVKIQGNKAYNYIKFLRKKGLIKSEKEGRTIKLSLTKEFERYFGLEKERIKEMLQKGLEHAKAREEAKAQKVAAKEDVASKPHAGAAAQTEAGPAAPVSARTPPTNVQYIEVAPAKKTEAKPAPKTETKHEIKAASPEIKPERKSVQKETRPEKPETLIAAIKPLKGKPKRKSKKTPPAAKIGTRRPGSGAMQAPRNIRL
jgi:segregation and condensation protein B